MISLAFTIDASWANESLTLVALRSGVELGTSEVSLSTVSGLTVATSTIDLSGAGAGDVEFLLREDSGFLAFQSETMKLTAAGELFEVLTHLQKLIESDQIIEDDVGTRKLKTLERGTTTELIPSKTAKQPDGSNLTDPLNQRLAGYRQ